MTATPMLMQFIIEPIDVKATPYYDSDNDGVIEVKRMRRTHTEPLMMPCGMDQTRPSISKLCDSVWPQQRWSPPQHVVVIDQCHICNVEREIETYAFFDHTHGCKICLACAPYVACHAVNACVYKPRQRCLCGVARPPLTQRGCLY